MALRFLADENFDNAVLRGVQRHLPTVDITRVQDEELSGKEDPAILDWAAQRDYVLLSHDVKTMPGHAYDRLRAGLPMPGVCLVPQALPIGVAIEELLTVIECGRRENLESKVLHLPL